MVYFTLLRSQWGPWTLCPSAPRSMCSGVVSSWRILSPALGKDTNPRHFWFLRLSLFTLKTGPEGPSNGSVVEAVLGAAKALLLRLSNSWPLQRGCCLKFTAARNLLPQTRGSLPKESVLALAYLLPPPCMGGSLQVLWLCNLHLEGLILVRR